MWKTCCHLCHEGNLFSFEKKKLRKRPATVEFFEPCLKADPNVADACLKLFRQKGFNFE